MRGLSTSILLFAPAALAKTIPYTLNITNAEVSLDGYRRSAVTLNGITPGPILTANKGDALLVTVNNRLTDHTMRLSATIHWHGIVSADNPKSSLTFNCGIRFSLTYTVRLVPTPDGLRRRPCLYHPVPHCSRVREELFCRFQALSKFRTVTRTRTTSKQAIRPARSGGFHGVSR